MKSFNQFDKRVIAENLKSLGQVACDQDNFPVAEDHLQQSLALSRVIDHKPVVVESLAELSMLQVEQRNQQIIHLLHEGSGLSLDLGARHDSTLVGSLGAFIDP